MKHQFNEKQIAALLELGLTRSQALLYLTSLKHGVLSVLELSRLSGINRQQIYGDAETLTRLGLYEISRKQRRKFVPATANKLLKLGRDKIAATEQTLAHVAEMIPQFDALATAKRNKVVTRYYEGPHKIREAFDDMLDTLKNTECVSFSGSLEEVYSFLPESYWDKWDKQFVKQGSTSRILAHRSDAGAWTASHDKIYHRETRWIDEFPMKANIEVFNNTVLIVSFHDEMAIWIESPLLAQSYRMLFNALWRHAETFVQ